LATARNPSRTIGHKDVLDIPRLALAIQYAVFRMRSHASRADFMNAKAGHRIFPGNLRVFRSGYLQHFRRLAAG
jgi:hypothetical protein